MEFEKGGVRAQRTLFVGYGTAWYGTGSDSLNFEKGYPFSRAYLNKDMRGAVFASRENPGFHF